MHKNEFSDQWGEIDTGVSQFGVHLMIDGYHGSATKLADEAHIERLLNSLPAQLGMHKITEPVVVEVGPQNHKDPGGLSGFVMIAESHISVHTFPLRGFISADVYTCQNQLDTKAIVSCLQHAFELQSVDQQQVKRGLNYPNQNIHAPVDQVSSQDVEELEVSNGG